MKRLLSKLGDAVFTAQLTKRFYILVLTLIILPLICLVVYTQHSFIQEQKLERQAELLLVSAYLRGSLPASFEQILKDYAALDKPAEEQVLIINQVLQPIVEDVSELHPNMGIGYYDIELDSVVAIGPEFSRSLLIHVPRSFPYFECYNSGMPEFGESGTSIGWQGDAILNVTYPIYWDHQIIGHTWANVRMNDIYAEVQQKSQKLILSILIIAFSVALIIRLIFRKLSWELTHIAQSINKDADFNSTNRRFPEIKPMLDLIKNQTMELKNNETRLRTIFLGSSIGIALLDEKAAYIEINPAMEKMLGYDASDFSNYTFKDLTHPHDLDKESELFQQIIQGNIGHYSIEKRFIQKDGNILWGNVKATFIKDASHIIYMVEDISERKRFEEEATRLERLNIVGQMAASISHEVRNPMTTVRGFLQLLKDKEDYKKDKLYFNLMIEELDRANSIMTEFLNISKINNTDIEPGNLSDIVNTLAPLIKADALASGKDLEVLTLEVPDLLINSKEIRQIILNLARNSLEAMDSGGKIIIKTYSESDEVVLAVQDRGKGIPPDILSKLGTPFLTTKENGTGLGLLNCYSIAHRHNARIVVETGNYGTTFYVRFNKYPREH